MIMWSGGVESTSLLKWYLENTSDEIFAHWVKMNNHEQDRMPYEERAIKTLLPLLSDIRPFDYSMSEADVSADHLMDYAIQYPLGALAMLQHQCQELYRGCCAEDQWSRNFYQTYPIMKKELRLTKGESLERVILNAAETIKPFLPPGVKIEDIIIIHEISYWPKTKHIQYLGELFKYTWSCRKPINGKVCGECHSCLERNIGFRGTSNIPEIAGRLAKETSDDK